MFDIFLQKENNGCSRGGPLKNNTAKVYWQNTSEINMKYVNYVLREGIDSHHLWEFEQLNLYHLREPMMCKCKAVGICLKHKLVPQGVQSVMR